MFKERIIPVDYPDFEEHGATPCSKSDPDAFFSKDYVDTPPSNRPVYQYEREAKLICSSCPYQLRCLEYALRNEDMLGIWGGTTELDRKKIRKGKLRSIRIPSSKHS